MNKRFQTRLGLNDLDHQIERTVLKHIRKFSRDGENPIHNATLYEPYNPEKFEGLEINLNLIRKLKDKMVLAVILWYFPEEISWSFWLWLDKNWGPYNKEFWAVAQTSKKLALGALLTTDKMSDKSFFGRLENVVRNIFLSFERKRRLKAKRPSRKRGHTDGRKGTGSSPTYRDIFYGSEIVLLTEKELYRLRVIEALKSYAFLQDTLDTISSLAIRQ